MRPDDTLPSSYDPEKTDPYVELSTGERFYIDYPKFDIVAIAHALGMNCRFNGHVKHYYSVAEHCVMVSHLMEQLGLGDPLEGLLHDCHEAYLTDVPTPIKCYLPDWVHLDHRLEDKMRAWFGLPEEKSDGCHTADKLALFIEAYWLLPSRGDHWVDPLGVKDWARRLTLEIDPGRWMCDGWSPPHAKKKFIERYNELMRGRQIWDVPKATPED